MCEPCRSLSDLDTAPLYVSFGRRFCWFRRLMLSGSFIRFADTANNRLDQMIDAFFFLSVQHAEAKLRCVLRPFADANGQLSAQTILDKGGFVPASLYVPGVNAQGREIADLPFRSARGSQKVLRLVARRVAHAIQFEPCERAEICGSRSLANRIRQIQLHETRDHPAGDRCGLVAGLRCV